MPAPRGLKNACRFKGSPALSSSSQFCSQLALSLPCLLILRCCRRSSVDLDTLPSATSRRLSGTPGPRTLNLGNFRNRDESDPKQRSCRNGEYLSCGRPPRMKTPGWWQQVFLDNKTSTGLRGRGRSEKAEREARREKKKSRGVLAIWSCLKIMAAR